MAATSLWVPAWVQALPVAGQACLTQHLQPLTAAALLASADVCSGRSAYSKSRLNAAGRSELLDIFFIHLPMDVHRFG
jgi:hypothetical protein